MGNMKQGITVIDRYHGNGEKPDRFVKRKTKHESLLEYLETEIGVAFAQCTESSGCFDCVVNGAPDCEATMTREQLRQLGRELIYLSFTGE